MTAAIPDPADEPTHHVWLAHHHIPIGVASLALDTSIYLHIWGEPNIVLALAISVTSATLFLTFLYGVACFVSHTSLTCDHCMDRVTVDGAAEAAHRARTLRHAHRGGQRVETAAVITCFFVPLIALIPGLSWVVPLHLAVAPWIAFISHTERTHRRLAPWCPRCRRGGRGDTHDPAPAPPPDPSGVAT